MKGIHVYFMKKKNLWLLAAVLGMAAGSCTSSKQTSEVSMNLTQYVDPYIGTGDHGHVFLGANVPFGMVQLGPTQYTRGWDWCSGYHYSDSILVGFGHMHLSGTGIGDLGDISFLPVLDGTQRETRFTHEQESVKPGYYTVRLADSGIQVELTATARTGFHRYTFPVDAADNMTVRINLRQGIGWDKWMASALQQENDTVVSGYRHSKGWANDQRVYFSAVFSHPIANYTAEGDSIGIFSFAGNGKPLQVRVGLSPVSTDNAKLNLQAENPVWDFEGIAAKADALWNSELNKLQIETTDDAARTVFYTAMYHSMTAPSVFCDVNGDYRGADGNTYRQADFVNYTTFSLWDTYRAAHPLATLIHPEKQRDFAQTMIHIYEQQGKLPVWHLVGNETDCMVGNPGIPVLADIVLKGYDVDKEKAYEAMKASALLEERSLGLLKEYGYIPYDKEPTHETVAKALEYALADDAVARVAKLLGKEDDYAYFSERSRSYKNYFDPETGFMRGLSSERKFREPFNPFHSTHRVDDYTEGNAWQYTWLVPHDVHGLVDLFGSEERFLSKLDSLFIVSGDLGEDASPDISGLIGQYAHGNEPSHHILYMYNFVGQPWKAAPLLRQTMETLYHNAPAGLCGNEDVGQMSAWYLLSSMGLYQVEPAGGTYVFGTPLFDAVTMKVRDGKTFKIVAHDNSKENIYVQSVRLNGVPYTKSYIHYEDIIKGGVLEFEMGNLPSEVFGSAVENRP